MPTIRQSLVASITRHYPFYSGCATFANEPIISRLAGASAEHVWCEVPGGEVLVPLNDYVGRAAFYVGDLDRKISWICRRIVRPGDTVLDIGANVGIVTLLLAKLVGDKGKVHAFEPNPILQEVLQRAVMRNRLTNIRLHATALGAETAKLQLRIPKFNAGGASLVRNRQLVDCEAVEVPVRRLSDVAAEEAITAIRLIKIDVEGFEAQVFKGGQQLLREMRPDAILFELNEPIPGRVADVPVIKLLADLDYQFFSVPRCLLRMRLKRLDPERSHRAVGHDVLAAPKGKCYAEIGRLVHAS